MLNNRLDRTQAVLGDFLRSRRESLSPLDVGLPAGKRRRTPGLRREEVAALAGVGITWYTWLEQGRSIRVSTSFLDNLSRVLKLDEIERRHLFLLAHQRPPAMTAQTGCQLSPMIRLLLDDLTLRPAYILNLRWDVLGWNAAANALFGFTERPESERNMLWMLFSDDQLNSKIVDWSAQAPQVLASFRRDFARAPEDDDMANLVAMLSEIAGDFKTLWSQHDVHGRCEGRRIFRTIDDGEVTFNHTSFIVDEDKHLRLVFYARTLKDDLESTA